MYVYPMCLQALGHLTILCKRMADANALTIWFYTCVFCTYMNICLSLYMYIYIYMYMSSSLSL